VVAKAREVIEVVASQLSLYISRNVSEIEREDDVMT
jgi:hypothetical protein